MNEIYSQFYGPLVEWVYDNSSSPLGDVEIAAFCEPRGLTTEQSWGLLRFCKERGLLDDRHSTFGGPCANLTPEGMDFVGTLRKRRSDPVYRVAVLRKELLRWLWSVKQSSPAGAGVTIKSFLEQPASVVDGIKYSLEEVDRAAGYLDDKGLITGIKASGRVGPIRATTTASGDDCVEEYGANPMEYERRHNSSGTVFNIHGSNTGNIAANSRDVTMNAKTIHGINMAEVVNFARAMRQAEPALGLPEAEAEEIVGLADDMEAEALRDAPDVTRIEHLAGRVLVILNSPLVSGALGGVLAAYGGALLPGLSEG